jgi:hypothetical protein
MQQRAKPGAVRLECNHCHFERVVEEVDVSPADVVIRHGRETGHKVSVRKLSG